MPQQGRIGQLWLLGSGIVLCILAIACAAAAMGAATVMDDALSSTCNSMVKAMSCMGAGDGFLDVDSCMVQMYTEFECTCSGSKPDTCDCSGTDIEQIKTLWVQVCLGLGLLGLVGGILFTGIPALVSAWKKVPICNVLCFSICSGLLTIVFIGCGAAFILIGLALQSPEVQNEMLQNCGMPDMGGSMPGGGAPPPSAGGAGGSADTFKDSTNGTGGVCMGLCVCVCVCVCV